MTKYFCDICGREIPRLSNGCTAKITKRHESEDGKTTWYETSRDILLCPECEYKLKVFLKIPGEDLP